MDDGNADDSNADTNISETTAVAKDIGSNNKGDDKNKQWYLVKRQSFYKNIPLQWKDRFENCCSLKLQSFFLFWFWINSWIKLFKGRMSMHFV